MNRFISSTQGEQKRAFKSGKSREILWIAVLGLALLLIAWFLFGGKDKKRTQQTESQTSNEQKISRLLEKIDGVGDADVMICETEDGVQGAVVVCEGANDFFVVIKVREAVATALGTEEKAVKIYLKKE